MEYSKADYCEGELEPGIDDGGVSDIADSHGTQALDPAEVVLYGPADSPQSRTVRAVASTDGRADATSRLRLPSGLAVVSGVGEEQNW